MTDSEKPTVGALLKNRRLELAIPLEEIAAKTRIRRAYLEALEEDLFEALPGEAYLKGFLSSYAGALGLEQGSVLRRWREQTAPAGGAKGGETLPPPPVAAGAIPRPRRKLPAVLLALAAVAVAGFALVFSVAGRPGIEAQAPATIAIAPQQPANPTASAPPAGAAEDRVVAVETGPPALPSIPAEGGILRLEATGPLTVDLAVDSLPVRRYALKAAAALRWKVGRQVRMAVDDPASVRVWLGDEPLDFAGRSEIVLQAAATAAPLEVSR